MAFGSTKQSIHQLISSEARIAPEPPTGAKGQSCPLAGFRLLEASAFEPADFPKLRPER